MWPMGDWIVHGWLADNINIILNEQKRLVPKSVPTDFDSSINFHFLWRMMVNAPPFCFVVTFAAEIYRQKKNPDKCIVIYEFDTSM